MEWKDIPDDLVRILHDELTGTADGSRQAEFEQWLAADEANRRFYERMKKPSALAGSLKEFRSFDPDEGMRQLRGKIRRRSRASLRRRATWWTGAAAVLLLTVVGVRFIADGPDDIPEIGRVSAIAMLTMPDGSVVALDENSKNNHIASSENVDITHSGSTLIYESQGERPELGQALYSVLNIPKGMIFDLRLEDGTHVWLNADSRLRFPSVFGADERRVVLEGEAYFDVSENVARPFIVETGGQRLTVLGTRFNLSAYPDAGRQVTTLDQGSVSLSVPGGGETILKPGQQAVLSSATGRFEVGPTDAAEVSSWRDGMFVFDGDTLDEVFVKLSRWYDFNYVIDSRVGGKIVRGNLRIADDVNPIFDVIEMIAQVDITHKSGTILIEMKK